jgi:membrane-bound lytic murein transglycosylase MltF
MALTGLRGGLAAAVVCALSLAVSSCRGGADAPPSAAPSTGPTAGASAPAPPAEEALDPAPEATPLPTDIPALAKPFKGDLDGMVKRRVIRVLTVQNPILYFMDRGREVGMTYESIKGFEKQVNAKLGNKLVTVHVIAIPVARDQLIPRLLAGHGDIAAAALTVTPERQKQVDFSDPAATGVREVLVSGPTGPAVASVDDLSGKEVYLRPSSSYAEHVRTLNKRLEAAGKAPVTILPAPEVLEDGDILEMVNAGLVPATIVDDFMADLYLQVFPALHKHAAVEGPPGDIAWAFRKGSPKLAAEVNRFIKSNQMGTLAGNVLVGKYLKTAKWVKNARSDEDRKRFLQMADLFKKYSTTYRFDYLLMAAQGYQESGLDQTRKSRVGAIGVMQVMPATARDKAVGIPNIEKLENNIHAGIKYNRWVADTYFKDPAITPLNQQLLAFASYNAGPGRVSGLRKEAKAQGLDPNKWFNNVELIAAKRIGRETVTYVANIFKYYLAYQMMSAGTRARREAKAEATKK